MEQSVGTILEKGFEAMGEESDILVITHKNGQCQAALHGSEENLAKALFALMHNENQAELARKLYRIVRFNTLNLIKNDSPYSKNFIHVAQKSIAEL